jgi:hypothetical protein
MIRKLIPAVLIASLAACATTGQRTSSSDAGSTASSTPSATAPSGSVDSGGYGEGSSGGGYGAGATGGSYGGTYSPMFSDGKSCDAQPVQKMIGTKLTGSVEDQIKQASSSSKTRVLKPGEVMTMEYDPHRINLILDGQGALTALRCG